MPFEAFADYFWVKEPRPPPEISNIFLDRIVGTSILLFLNSLLALFVFYVIWTQSSSLGSFKWYLLNQLVISQALEFGLLMYSPVLMGSYLALYAAGFYGYIAPPKLLYFSIFMGLAGCIHAFSGIFLSLFNRFVFLFRPHLKELLHNKYTLLIIVLFHAFFDGMFIYACYNSVMDHDTMVERAHNDSGHTLDRWLKEDRFIYVPEYYGRTRSFSFVTLCTLIVIFFTLIGVIIWFIVNVFILKRTSKTLSENSAYLLIAVLVQAGCSLLFFFLPGMFILACWTFAIDGSGNAVNWILQLFSVNGTSDMLAMLYFVRPYKEYCKRILRKVFKIKSTSIIAKFMTTTHATSSVY